MLRPNVARACGLALVTLLALPAVTWAQNGSIAGVVRDGTGAVLPGVSVEAASPVLIEKVRLAVSDDQGQFKIVDLRPGAYTVTFSLPGFNSIKREGIELTTGFTATVNAELSVGSVQETVTVTGESPVVDIQNVREQRVMSEDVIKALPTGRTTMGLAQLVPGLLLQEAGATYADVGGLLGEGQRLVFHGSSANDTYLLINGLSAQRQSASTGLIRPDVGVVEEVVLQLGGNPAEYQRGGVVTNMVSKEGSNRFTASFFGGWSGSGLQSNNLTDELRASGLQAVNRLDHTWDWSGHVGGPIKRDKLWFFTGVRYWGTDEMIAGIFHDSNLSDFAYTPDLSRQAHQRTWVFSSTGRVTWQLTPRNKVGGYFVHQPRGNFGTPNLGAGSGPILAPEASIYQHNTKNWYTQGTWTSTVSSRVLLEAGVALGEDLSPRRAIEGITKDMWPIFDAGSNVTYGAPPLEQDLGGTVKYTRASMSYITGSHAFKVGTTLDYIESNNYFFVNHDTNLRFLNGVPISVTLLTTPRRHIERVSPMLGLFAQDQWTVNRLTINAGLRFDYHNSYVPEINLPPVQFVGARVYPEVDNVPNWKDLSPRFGASYDVFGNGKTAIKGNLSRYLLDQTVGFAGRNNPLNTSVNSATRTWTDLNGNFTPQCNFVDPAENGECGRLSDLAFGTQRITTFFDPDLLTGYGKRPDNWEASVSLQQELVPRVALNAGFYRRWFGKFQVTDNRSVTPADFNPYCITSPNDARLPGGGGQQLCGLYNVKPAKFGLSDNFVTLADNFGKQTEVFEGVDLSVNARLGKGTLLQGGFSTGRSKTNNCFAIDSPQATRAGFCDVTPPFLTQVKFLGSYTFPWDVELSGSLQSNSGPPITATYTARNAEIAPTLGRNLASGANGTATVELIPPGTLYGDRMFQVDLRASKNFKMGRGRFRAMFDVYNLFNASDVLQVNTGYGSAWLRPLFVLPGRLARLGVQMDF